MWWNKINEEERKKSFEKIGQQDFILLMKREIEEGIYYQYYHLKDKNSSNRSEDQLLLPGLVNTRPQSVKNICKTRIDRINYNFIILIGNKVKLLLFNNMWEILHDMYLQSKMSF